jgi:hypothetical protein
MGSVRRAGPEVRKRRGRLHMLRTPWMRRWEANPSVVGRQVAILHLQRDLSYSHLSREVLTCYTMTYILQDQGSLQALGPCFTFQKYELLGTPFGRSSPQQLPSETVWKVRTGSNSWLLEPAQRCAMAPLWALCATKEHAIRPAQLLSRQSLHGRL